MKVLIVSKTRMSSAVCVGGVLETGRLVRLLKLNGHNLDENVTIHVGNVLEIEFSERREIAPPHIEDILVQSWNLLKTVSIDSALIEKLGCKIWRGSSEVLFDGCLEWTASGSGYISRTGALPQNSVGFWIPDKNLTRNDYDGNVKFGYPIKWRSIKFVGLQEPTSIIPAGTLVRVSLARWWSPNEKEERCYLQLSGWY